MGLGSNLNMDKGKQETGINTDIIEYKDIGDLLCIKVMIKKDLR